MIVKIDDKAIKDLSKMDKKLALKIFSKIEELEHFPRVSNFKKLVNFQPEFRLRVGNYRILFDIEADIITVYRVRHRSKSYR
ncbi:type II toxin-antitoxin system RelE/ParE family toxin [Thiotrichales bacterium HSG1]|nr:type II toxin-antitoxin system RelE/ParE family toxin [Thiotrichales bacterium HSG1]